ncbi:MAG: EAL domain-containing protein [Dehalococcoidia bacterium]
MRGLYLIGLAVVAVVPAALMLALASLFATDQVNRELGQASAASITESERLLDRTVAELRELAPLSGQSCTPEVIARLAQATTRSTRLAEVGLFGPDLITYCTRDGATRTRHVVVSNESVPTQGVFLAWREFARIEPTPLVVHVRLADGGGVTGLIEPMEFLERMESNLVGDGGTLTLSIVGGPVIGRAVEREDGTTRQVVVRISSATYPILVQAGTDDAVVWSRFVQVAPVFLAIGLVFSTLIIWIGLLSLRRRRTLDEDLRVALSRREFEVFYQPIVDIQADRCVGAEALLRWRHPKRGLLRPDVFIPLAEETGFIIPITRWMLGRVRADILLSFPEQQGIHVGVNLVAEHLRDHQIVDDLRMLLEDGTLNPRSLTLEITERRIIDDFRDIAVEVMAGIHRLGCSIAVDDFGTGHSGLASLQQFSVDYLKIDKVFVETIGTDALSRPILDSIIDLGRKLSLELVAEGVEQRHQVAYLRERGVRYGQGYYFSYPLPLAGFARFFREYNGVNAATAGSV